MDKRDPALAPPTLSPVKDVAAARANAQYRSEHEAVPVLPPKLQLESKLNFRYRGDLFGQHGVYSDANLYMSRLPSSRKGSILRPKAGAAYLKLAPMPSQPLSPLASLQQREKLSGGASKSDKVSRKRQYALAIEAMATSAALRSSLLSDNVIPSLLCLLRTKDSTTLASCIATLCFLSNDPLGRDALSKNGAVPLLTAMIASLPLAAYHHLYNGDTMSRHTLAHNYLATLANLTIEDTFEGVFVKEKALDSILRHRKATVLSERMVVFAILNLSCPAFSYPRVDDVIHAIHELTREPTLSNDHYEMLSQALYNLSCTRLNQPKLVDGDAVSILRKLITLRGNALSESEDTTMNIQVDTTRLNALMTMWHLTENPFCRRALTRPDSIRTLVDTVQASAVVADDRLKCALMVMLSLASDEASRQPLSSAGSLDVLAELVVQLREHGRHRKELVAAVYRLMALILSAPAAVEDVSPSFLAFLLSFRHGDDDPLSKSCPRYVLFSLASILSWNESDEGGAHGHPTRPPTSVITTMIDSGPGAHHQRTNIDDLLDDPAHLDPLLKHVNAVGFARDDSPEVLLQMLLLHNLSFRYDKVEIARRASPRLQALAHLTTSSTILGVVCGTLFSLCQEYETHRELHAAGILALLPVLLDRCRHDAATQTQCLDIVSIVFDARMLARSDLVALMTLMAPSLVMLCCEASNSTSASIRASCAACFARFASIEECRPAMGHHGVIRALAILATEEVTQTLRLCVSAYSDLSRDAAICAQLIGSGIIKSLTFLAAAPEEAVRRACAMTLCNLSTSEENIGALAKSGALKALLVISCVKSNDPETRRICMKAAMNLLRLPANIPLLCQDGLVWAFGLFTSGMEPKDFDILCDAFCALAFYPMTRRGIAKPAILNAMLAVLDSPCVTLSATIKLLKGVSNVLCDAPYATQLLHASILPHLIALVQRTTLDANASDGTLPITPAQVSEARALVAQVLVLLFQSCPDAESEFAEPDMLRTIATLLHTDHTDCGRCCSILLYQMSLHTATRSRLVAGSADNTPSLVELLPALFLCISRDTQSLLVRLLFNVSCDPQLNRLLCVGDVIACVRAAMPTKTTTLSIDVASYCSGVLRNLSCEASFHVALVEQSATALLQKLFDVDDDATKEDVAVCLCNVFMGKINSSALLARGVLPIVLWLCASPESRALGTTVVRKLALAPGNAQPLVDGGVISHLALLMEDGKSSLFVQTNCIATFCCVARKPGVAVLLASYGVIANVLELLGVQHVRDPLFEAMCVDLLSTLAEFARADDPIESKLASILFGLIESDDSTPLTHGQVERATASSWQTDRAFLTRDAESSLSLPTLSSAHQRVAAKPSMLRHTLYPIRFAGYAVDFLPMASTIEVRTIEQIVPSLAILGEACAEPPSDAVAIAVHEPAPPSRFDFSPLPMFTKHRTPFAAIPSMPPDQHRQPQ